MMLSRAATGHFRRSAVSVSIKSTVNIYHGPRLLARSPQFPRNARFFSPLSSVFATQDDTDRPSASPFFQQQVRWKRKGGASAFSEPRPPTRKQRKAYYRRKRRLYHEREGKHSAPGSKAGYRRQWNEETFQELLDYNTKNETMEQARLEYDYGDALVDDLMGNTANLTSLPTPEPHYIGHRHKQFYNQVRTKMDIYRDAIQQLDDSGSRGTADDIVTLPSPPSDHEISLVIRAYRDRNGTKTRPIGIVKALKHLLTDLSLSTSLFGEKTFTSLLTCCRTPKEARRIFRLQRELQHPISSVSWGILVDIHAKLGDYEGCDAVLKEMVTEGLLPTLPAYTSLLAACYKVCNNGTIPHAIRDKASKLGWNRWKEMNIMGIEPDAMAYGALLRLIGARGQPEKAINILEEMQTMGVKPTTLCFTSALKAVSRSHQTAVRFERGASKKNRRREQITAHHGKLARKIVIMAENAEVEHDDGFVAQLIMCAGAAGDSATAKAILIASEIRKMDELRTIGPEEHLRRIRGESVASRGPHALAEGLDGSLSPIVTEQQSEPHTLQTQNGLRREKHYPTFQEREYGNDTRKLTALLFAYSQAVDGNGLGMQWAGRYSKGYLCENSLRLLITRPQPKYFNPAIPGVSSTEVGMGSISWQDEEPEHLSKSLRRAKYRGIKQDDTVGNTMENIDETFFEMFRDDYTDKMDNDPAVDPMLLNKEEWEALNEARAADAFRERMNHKSKGDDSSIEEATYRESDEEWYFDDDARKWKTRKRVVETAVSVNTVGNAGDSLDDDEDLNIHSDNAEANDDGEEERKLYFDDNARKWMTRPKPKKAEPNFEMENLSEISSSEAAQLANLEVEFQTFFQEIKDQIKVAGDDIDLDESEAREFFNLTRDQDGDDDFRSESGNEKDEVIPPNFESFFADIKDEWDITEDEAREMFDSFDTSDAGGSSSDVVAMQERALDVLPPNPVLEPEETLQQHKDEMHPTLTQQVQQRQGSHETMDLIDSRVDSSMQLEETGTNPKLVAIQAALPGLPASRAKKVLRAFETSLNYPSILELVPILRENMPDELTSGWLQRRNVRNAEVVLQQAKEEDVVDVYLLNGALQVKTSAGSLDEALAYHENEFEKHGLTPTAYSDRLVLQMLVRNNRVSRALVFKQKIEEDGRLLDIASYGSLIEYYGNHGKLGSAVLVLKECIDTHGAPPGEKSLAKLRLLCRQNGLESKLRLEENIGKDPVEWLRHGEAHLKREKSFKGRRDVNLARNRMVQA